MLHGIVSNSWTQVIPSLNFPVTWVISVRNQDVLSLAFFKILSLIFYSLIMLNAAFSLFQLIILLDVSEALWICGLMPLFWKNFCNYSYVFFFLFLIYPLYIHAIDFIVFLQFWDNLFFFSFCFPFWRFPIDIASSSLIDLFPLWNDQFISVSFISVSLQLILVIHFEFLRFPCHLY